MVVVNMALGESHIPFHPVSSYLQRKPNGLLVALCSNMVPILVRWNTETRFRTNSNPKPRPIPSRTYSTYPKFFVSELTGCLYFHLPPTQNEKKKWVDRTIPKSNPPPNGFIKKMHHTRFQSVWQLDSTRSIDEENDDKAWDFDCVCHPICHLFFNEAWTSRKLNSIHFFRDAWFLAQNMALSHDIHSRYLNLIHFVV